MLTSSLKVMHIDASVAEADIGAVRPGPEGEVHGSGVSGTRSSRVRSSASASSPSADSTVVAYPVTFSVQNPELKLRPGMSADVRIFVAEARDVLAVREGALRFSPDAEGTGNRTRLWISRDGRDAEAVDVTPGLSDGAYTQVTPKEDSEARSRRARRHRLPAPRKGRRFETRHQLGKK